MCVRACVCVLTQFVSVKIRRSVKMVEMRLMKENMTRTKKNADLVLNQEEEVSLM